MKADVNISLSLLKMYINTFWLTAIIGIKISAPGEARTHGLQIMRLTRCLLRYGGGVESTNRLSHPLISTSQIVNKKFCTHGGTRTPNLRFRRPTPYPLGHAGNTWSSVEFLSPHGNRPLQYKQKERSTAPCIPRRSPIQVLTWLNVA